jgi:hypothetical protein
MRVPSGYTDAPAAHCVKGLALMPSQRFLCQLGLLALSLGVMQGEASAAEWSISSADAAPGDRISIDVAIAGDGITSSGAIEIAFDNGRLSLPVESGIIPGAGGGAASAHALRSTGCSFSATSSIRSRYLKARRFFAGFLSKWSDRLPLVALR